MTKNLPARSNRIRKKEPDFYCNARKRKKNEYCRQRAGFGTDHVREGRCKFHGGLTPSKHGVYSKLLPARFQELLENIQPEEVIDLTHEIIKLKTLLIELAEVQDGDPEIEIELDENGDPVKKKFSHLTINEKLDYNIKLVTAISRVASIIGANRERAAKRQDFRAELIKFISPLVGAFYEELEFVIRDKRISREDISRSHKERFEHRTVWN